MRFIFKPFNYYINILKIIDYCIKVVLFLHVQWMSLQQNIKAKISSLFPLVPGVPFIRVFAMDQDDPESPNADLYYTVVSQFPMKNNIPLFQIDHKTGQISTTEQGNNTHQRADKNPDGGRNIW